MSEKVNELKRKIENNKSNKIDNDDELYNIMYAAAKRSNGELWSGVGRYLRQAEKDNEMIIKQLDELKILLRTLLNDES